MKRFIIITILSFLGCSLYAQLDIRVGVSSTFKSVNFGGSTVYGNFLYRRTNDWYFGGNSFAPGPVIDFEYRFKRKFWKKNAGETFKSLAITIHKSFMVGIHLNDHVNEERFLNREFGFEDGVISRWANRYVHVPMIFKLNVQPFILDENFHIGFGLGLTHSFLVSSTLEEKIFIYERGEEGFIRFDAQGERIVQQEISDKKDVKPFSKSYVPMFAFELNASFKRLYMGMRGWFSLQNQYMSEFRDNWSLNSDQSIYLTLYDSYGKVTYAGGALVLSYKVN